MLPSFPTEAEARHEEGFLNSADHLRLFWQRYTPPRAEGDGARAPRRRRSLRPLPGDHRRARAGGLPGGARGLPRPRPVRRPALARGRVRRLPARPRRLRREALPGRHRGRALFVVGHSQGGLIAALWALRARRAPLRRSCSPSPYFGLAIGRPRAKVLAARLIGRVVPWLPSRRARPRAADQRRGAAALDRPRSRSTGARRRRAGSRSRAARSSRRSAAPASSRRRCSCSPRARTGSRTSSAARTFVDAARSQRQADRRVRRVPTRDLQRGPPRQSRSARRSPG